MNEKARVFHLDVLALHNSELYASLLYESDVVSENIKEICFEDEDGLEMDPEQGYFMRKDRKKYWISKEVFKNLPIRVRDENQILKHKEDIIINPLNPAAFKITPEQCHTFKNLIDQLVPFQHSEHKQWTLLKIISVVGYVSKIFVCISSMPEFGKSSVYDVLNGLTDRCPVFKPRSVPGVLNKINSTGNMIFDDV